MLASQSPMKIIMMSSETPALNVDKRVRPPDLTLIIECPIIAQPAMPPMSLLLMLLIPWPSHYDSCRFLSLLVSVRSSTMIAVIIDSSKPTTASAAEYGGTIISVSRFSGTLGHKNIGRLSGSEPLSPTVCIFRPI